jgi:hypothetical protein
MHKKYIVTFIVIAVIIVIVLVIYIFGRHHTLPDGSGLVKPHSFYVDKHADTLKYLIAVYPKGKESFEKMDVVDLAIFYNSLWYYYNCEASFNQTFGEDGTFGTPVKHCWQDLPGCGKEWPKLPYTPQGYLYSFQDWLNDIWNPWIYSKSDKPPSYFTSATPGITIWAWFSGPGPLFMPQRVIARMVYDHTRPTLKIWEDVYTKGEYHAYKQPDLTPGYVGEFSSYWNYPKNWWLGTPDHGYIEVTYSDIMEIGSGALVWWNGAPGSGIFVNVGKCKKARNKADGAFQLAKEMSQTAKGKAQLKEWFFSDDPYDIIAGCIQSPCRQTGATVWDPVKGQKTTLNFCTGGGAPFMGLPTRGDGWNTVNAFDSSDWNTWCQTTTGGDPNRPWAFNLPNKCIDKITTGSSYMADRIAAQGAFDEAMSCMGWWLGYDTIQLTQSANGNGFWQVETLELRNFPPEVKQRDYSTFLEVKYDSKGDPTIYWRLDNGWIKQYMDSVSQYISIRDPTDIMNDSKAEKCVFPVLWEDQKTLGWTWNVTCQGTISNMFTKLSLNGATDPPQVWNQCYPGGLGFGRQPMNSPNSPPFG